MTSLPNHQETFTQWMVEHRGIVIKIVRSFTHNASDEDDLAQEIAIDVWRSVPRFNGDAKVSTWIWRIALNRAISWRRKPRPLTASFNSNDDSLVLAATDRTDSVVALDHVYQAIRTLAPLDRCLLMLSLEGYSYQEMAEVTGISQSNVGARLTRARQSLTTRLERV